MDGGDRGVDVGDRGVRGGEVWAGLGWGGGCVEAVEVAGEECGG